MMKKVIVMTLVCLMTVSCLVSPACADSERIKKTINYTIYINSDVGFLYTDYNTATLGEIQDDCLGSFSIFSKETEMKKVDTFHIEQFSFKPYFVEQNGTNYYYDSLIIIPAYFEDKINKVFDRIRTEDGGIADTFAIYKDDGTMIYCAMREEKEVNGYKDYLMIYATGLKKNEKHLKKVVDKAMISSYYSVSPL